MPEHVQAAVDFHPSAHFHKHDVCYRLLPACTAAFLEPSQACILGGINVQETHQQSNSITIVLFEWVATVKHQPRASLHQATQPAQAT